MRSYSCICCSWRSAWSSSRSTTRNSRGSFFCEFVCGFVYGIGLFEPELNSELLRFDFLVFCFLVCLGGLFMGLVCGFCCLFKFGSSRSTTPSSRGSFFFVWVLVLGCLGFCIWDWCVGFCLWFVCGFVCGFVWVCLICVHLFGFICFGFFWFVCLFQFVFGFIWLCF